MGPKQALVSGHKKAPFFPCSLIATALLLQEIANHSNPVYSGLVFFNNLLKTYTRLVTGGYVAEMGPNYIFKSGVVTGSKSEIRRIIGGWQNFGPAKQADFMFDVTVAIAFSLRIHLFQQQHVRAFTKRGRSHYVCHVIPI